MIYKSLGPLDKAIYKHFRYICIHNLTLNPLTAGAAYIRVFIFYQHIMYDLLNMLKCDINQQYLKTGDLHIVKSK